jgi:hypothetical protein
MSEDGAFRQGETGMFVELAGVLAGLSQRLNEHEMSGKGEYLVSKHRRTPISLAHTHTHTLLCTTRTHMHTHTHNKQETKTHMHTHIRAGACIHIHLYWLG